MSLNLACFSLVLLLLVCSTTSAQSSPAAKIPIKEVSIFKDGHAFVLHEGSMPTTTSGEVILDHLPSPILGSFWPYSTDKNAKLSAAMAVRQKVKVDRIALDLKSLFAANIGQEVLITERSSGNIQGAKYLATVLSVPKAEVKDVKEELTVPSQPSLVILKTDEGTRVVSIDHIQDVTFKNSFKPSVETEEFRNQLLLKLDWTKEPKSQADVGLVYIQKGIRWIPSYRIDIDGKGQATIKLQATIINELDDLNNVTANLIVGVPNFLFKDTLDPMALQKATPQLSRYFESGRTDSNLTSNVVMTQTARMGEYRRSSDEEEQPVGESQEDLFIFTLKNISLRKDARMVATLAEQQLSYKDVFTLDLPFAPPIEMQATINDQTQSGLAKLLDAPKVVHKIRLINGTSFPFTTGPAVLFSSGNLLSESLVTYTPQGASTDIELTKAVDLQIKKSEKELKRTPGAIHRNSYDYTLVELAGNITLTNYRKQPVYIEVRRFVLGNPSSASSNAVVEKINVFEDDSYSPDTNYPSWLSRRYGWPDWWSQFNGVGKISWKVDLESGK
ncbi:MAG: hypothetical protein JNN15_16875, partial [Blastocatellia bacterium]|nr:hypothetical protein [Blastocatellia bacterium]